MTRLSPGLIPAHWITLLVLFGAQLISLCTGSFLRCSVPRERGAPDARSVQVSFRDYGTFVIVLSFVWSCSSLAARTSIPRRCAPILRASPFPHADAHFFAASVSVAIAVDRRLNHTTCHTSSKSRRNVRSASATRSCSSSGELAHVGNYLFKSLGHIQSIAC